MIFKKKLKEVVSKFFRQLMSPLFGVIWIFLITLVLPFFVAIESGRGIIGEIVEFFLIQIIFLFVLEIIFRIGYLWNRTRTYHLSIKRNFSFQRVLLIIHFTEGVFPLIDILLII